MTMSMLLFQEVILCVYERCKDVKTVIDLLKYQRHYLSGPQSSELVVNKEDLQSTSAFFACGTPEQETNIGTRKSHP